MAVLGGLTVSGCPREVGGFRFGPLREAVPRGAHVEGSYTCVSPNSGLESDRDKESFKSIPDELEGVKGRD